MLPSEIKKLIKAESVLMEQELAALSPERMGHLSGEEIKRRCERIRQIAHRINEHAQRLNQAYIDRGGYICEHGMDC